MKVALVVVGTALFIFACGSGTGNARDGEEEPWDEDVLVVADDGPSLPDKTFPDTESVNEEPIEGGMPDETSDGITGDENGSDDGTVEEEDADGDGVPDSIEKPNGVPVDTDGDGTPDYLDSDSDGDGISDSVECSNLPCRDSDGDGVPDYLDTDSDSDGLSDEQETVFGTDSTKEDSDDDGVSDLAEVSYGSDPTDPNSTIPPEDFYVVLPYAPGEDVERELDFSTAIQKADILFLLDLSGSMSGEMDNIKTSLMGTIIPGIVTAVPDAAIGLATFDDWRGINNDPVHPSFDDHIYTLLQRPTTDTATITSAVLGLSYLSNGGQEPQIEAIYQAATGEGFSGKFDYNYVNPPYHWAATFYPQIPAKNCIGAEGSIGGACFREQAMPIFIMMTDEAFTAAVTNPNYFVWDTTPPYQLPHTRDEAIAAMNAIQAKFIGISSFEPLGWNYDPKPDLEAVCLGTGSTDENGMPFFYEIGADGSQMSLQIVQAISELAQKVRMDVMTERLPLPNPQQVDTTQFIKMVTPLSADPANGYDSKDETVFYGVKPGITVTFMVRFENDFYEPTGPDATLFRAQITVLGDGALLDTREVLIIVPGKIKNSGEQQ